MDDTEANIDGSGRNKSQKRNSRYRTSWLSDTKVCRASRTNHLCIDITHLSVGLQKLRLKDSFGTQPAKGRNATVKERANTE